MTLTILQSTTTDNTIRSRRSTRAFEARDLSMSMVRELLSLAARAPSGTNMQPWRVTILDRPHIDAMAKAIAASGIKPHQAPWDDYRYYPETFPEPFAERRRTVGAALYGLLGIGRRDVKAMRRHFERNFRFFGAPVGLVISIDRRLEKGSWLDLGMFIQTLLLAAQARGIGSCVQAAFAPYHHHIRPVIGLPETDVLVCGIALGYADESRAENGLRTERAPLDEWVVDLSRCPAPGRLDTAA